MKSLSSIYLLALALTLGVEVAIGLVAPVVFRSDLYITPGTLSTLEAGTLLAQVFIKYNYIALGVALFAVLFELFTWRKNTCDFRLKISSAMLSALLLVLAIMFYSFTNYIAEAAKIGESAVNDEFMSVHGASETTLKIIMIARLVLFFLRAKMSLKDNA